MTPTPTTPTLQQRNGCSRHVDAYRLHDFEVLDSRGEKVGSTGWIWLDSSGKHGEFVGIKMHWFRGTALAVPMAGARIDVEAATIQVAYRKDQIKCASRFAIDRVPTPTERDQMYANFSRSTGANARGMIHPARTM